MRRDGDYKERVVNKETWEGEEGIKGITGKRRQRLKLKMKMKKKKLQLHCLSSSPMKHTTEKEREKGILVIFISV